MKEQSSYLPKNNTNYFCQICMNNNNLQVNSSKEFEIKAGYEQVGLVWFTSISTHIGQWISWDELQSEGEETEFDLKTRREIISF